MLNLLILYPLELFAFLALFYEKSRLTAKNGESKNKPERKAPNDHQTYANYANKNYEANMLNSDKVLRCHIIATPINYLQKQSALTINVKTGVLRFQQILLWAYHLLKTCMCQFLHIKSKNFYLFFALGFNIIHQVNSLLYIFLKCLIIGILFNIFPYVGFVHCNYF